MTATKVHQRLAANVPAGLKVAVRIVDDPYEQGASIAVLASTRDDPLFGMLSRRQIDQAQFSAGRRLQDFYEQSQIGGVSAIDPSKEAVDGGRIPEPITDRQIKAIRRLKEAREGIGAADYALLWDVLCRGLTLRGAASYRGLLPVPDCADMKALGRQFRGGLERLAKLWGYASWPALTPLTKTGKSSSNGKITTIPSS